MRHGLMIVMLMLSGSALASMAEHAQRANTAGIDVITYRTQVKDMVVIVAALPAGDAMAEPGNAAVPTLSMVVMQERIGLPSMWTVQAPHSAKPHPNFVPVMPRTSRRTHSSGVSSSTSTVWFVPLILIIKAMGVLRTSGWWRRIEAAPQHRYAVAKISKRPQSGL